MARHKTDPGAGYVHSDDHCDLCAAQAAWACREAEGHQGDISQLHRRVSELERKRATSEIRDEEREKRATFYRRMFYAIATSGAVPWVWQFGVWLIKKLGG